MSDKRTLEKTGKNEYTLTIDQKEGTRIQVAKYTKDEMKENLQMTTQNINAIMARKIQVEKELKKIDVEDSEELRALLENMKKVQALEKKVNHEMELKRIVMDLDNLLVQKNEIRTVLPELFRAGNK